LQRTSMLLGPPFQGSDGFRREIANKDVWHAVSRLDSRMLSVRWLSAPTKIREQGSLLYMATEKLTVTVQAGLDSEARPMGARRALCQSISGDTGGTRSTRSPQCAAYARMGADASESPGASRTGRLESRATGYRRCPGCS